MSDWLRTRLPEVCAFPDALHDIDEFLLGVDVHFGVDVAYVGFHCVVRQEQLFLDDGACASASEQLKHIHLTIRQAESPSDSSAVLLER